MRLSVGVTILARMVDAACWREDEQKVSGNGLGANRDAIFFLSEQGVLTNLDSDWARTVRCDWAREDWRVDDGSVDCEPDQDLTDRIVIMLLQHRGSDRRIRGEGLKILIPTSLNTQDVWISSVEFLERIGVASITGRSKRRITASEPRIYNLMFKSQLDKNIVEADVLEADITAERYFSWK